MLTARETHHETARLFFMEHGGLEPRPSVVAFRKWMKAEHPELTVYDLMELWSDYTGTERRGPRLDYITGRKQ